MKALMKRYQKSRTRQTRTALAEANGRLGRLQNSGRSTRSVAVIMKMNLGQRMSRRQEPLGLNLMLRSRET